MGEPVPYFCPGCVEKLTTKLEIYSPPYELTLFAPPGIQVEIKSKLPYLSFFKVNESGVLQKIVGKDFNITLPPYYDFRNGTRIVFQGFIEDENLSSMESKAVFKINRSIEIKTRWKRQYFLKVISPYGTIKETGWYDEGSIVRVNVSPNRVVLSSELFWDEVAVFKGWKKMEGNEVLVNAPKTVEAEWEVERETKWLPIAIMILTILSVILIAVITRKIKNHSVKMRQRSYSEKMYFCPYCGKSVPVWAKFCSSCGRKLAEEVIEEEI